MTTSPSSPEDDSVDLERVRRVKEAHEQALMAKANVVGVGIGSKHGTGKPTKHPAIVVMVSRKRPESQLADKDRIPAELDGIPVDVQEVGEIGIQ